MTVLRALVGAARFELPMVGDLQPGDLWRVAVVDGRAGTVTFERVEAEPGTFRSRGDGLHPRVPDARPISDEEARKLADELDAALEAGRRDLQAMRLAPGG